MSPAGSNADPREAKKPQIGWLFSVVLVRVSAGHQPAAPSASAALIHEDKSATCPLHRAEPWWPSTNKKARPSLGYGIGAATGVCHATRQSRWQPSLSCSGKSKRTRQLAGRLPLRPRSSKRGAIGKLLAAQVRKAFCWIIGLVQAEEMRIWILRTPAGKKVHLSVPFCLFCPIGLVRKPWSLWRPTQPMQMMRYDRRKLHALEMVPT